MKNIVMAIAGLGMIVSAAAQADSSLGNFGPYTNASNQANHSGQQVVIPAEGRLNAYQPVAELPKSKGNAQAATSSEGHLSGYHS